MLLGTLLIAYFVDNCVVCPLELILLELELIRETKFTSSFITSKPGCNIIDEKSIIELQG